MSDAFRSFLQDFDCAIRNTDPAEIMNCPIKPEFLQLMRLDQLMAFQQILTRLPGRKTYLKNRSIQAVQTELIYRYLVKIPRDFGSLQQLLEEQYPTDALTLALPKLTQAVTADTDWIHQEAVFLSELRQVIDRGSQFQDIIARILYSFAPQTDQNQASTHITFVRGTTVQHSPN